MMRHVAPVAIDRRRYLGHPGLFQRAAVRFRLAHVGQLEARRRRKMQAVRLRHEAGGVAHRGHLDAGLGAIDKAVEHFRVDRLAVGNIQVLVEDVPDVVGIGFVIVRLIARALAGANHLEAGGADRIDLFANQRRLIAPG
jgi:hypothetical protein